MTMQQVLTNQITLTNFSIKLNGSDISKQISHDLILLEVQQNLYLPAMFIVALHAVDMGFPPGARFKVGDEVTIGFEDTSGTAQKLIVGEVTSIELEAEVVNLSTLTVRGYDRLHRLQRGRLTRSFLQMKDSDILSKMAGEGGMSGEGTTSEVHEYLLQNNETNLEFLQRRAARLGMEIVVDDKKLKLREKKPPPPVAVSWGKDLQRFNIRQSSHSDIDEVLVRGWDAKLKKELVGTASKAATHKFGSSKISVAYQTVDTQGDAKKIAEAVLTEMKSRMLQAQFLTLGNPHLGVGQNLKAAGIGDQFGTNEFYITSCTHRYDLVSGYTTYCEANGRDANSYAELVGSEARQPEKVPGLVVGIVTNLKDPDNMGRVKVKYPVLPLNEGKEIESDWARLVMPMSGNGSGFFFLPEVNDEVIVYFENGDITRPYVLGSVWNSKDKTPKQQSELVGGDGKVKERLLKTTSGHILSFDDSADAPKISIIDKSTKNKLIIDTTSKTITIETDASGGNITLKATGGKISLESKDFEVKATNSASIEGTASAKVKTAQLELKADASAKMEGATLELKGSGTAKLEGGAMTEIKGGIIKLN